MKLRSRVCRDLLLTATLLGVIMNSAHADTTVGRWCDKAIPSMSQYNTILEIVVTIRGEIELRTQHSDGSRIMTKLNDLGNGIFAAEGSGTDEKYRVEPDGTLALLNYAGFTRIAKRLGDMPQRGDCGI